MKWDVGEECREVYDFLFLHMSSFFRGKGCVEEGGVVQWLERRGHNPNVRCSSHLLVRFKDM